MTNKEAIERLEQQKIEYLEEWVDYGGVAKAYDMAIQALSEKSRTRWIPISSLEELPKDGSIWITRDFGAYKDVDVIYWDKTEWSEDVDNVVAYMPYIEPEPYKGERSDK